MRWWPTFAATVNTTVGSPVLVVRGRAGSAAVAIADAVRSHATSTGAATREFWVEGSCRDAGPMAQQRMFEVERRFLEASNE
jgi:hypothetical protein